MARYIDADRLKTKIHELYVQPSIELWQVVNCVDHSPTADVVPKSEYQALKEMLEAAIAGQETLQKAFAEAKTEVAREIFEEIEKHGLKPIPEAETIYVLSKNQFAELKKEYTEGNDEGI